MILNENYFDDLKLTDDDIDSSYDIAVSHNKEYDTTEEWFMDMKSKYAHCIEIPLKRDIQWELNPKPIIKRLFYMFDVYGMEYSEPTLQEHRYIKQNLQNNYFKYNFIDYNGYKLISNYYKTQEIVDRTNNTISVVIFFNIPEAKTYKRACMFVSSILSYIQNDMIKDYTYGDFNVWDFKSMVYNRKFSKNSVIATSDIISIIILFFPEKKYDDIEKELYADDDALLNKLLKCFRFESYNGNWWQSSMR